MSRFVCGRWGASNNGLLSRGWFRSLLALIKTDRELIEPCGPWERDDQVLLEMTAGPKGAPNEQPRRTATIYTYRCTACGQERRERVAVNSR